MDPKTDETCEIASHHVATSTIVGNPVQDETCASTGRLMLFLQAVET